MIFIKKRKNYTYRYGFTLIEMILATTLSSIIVTITVVVTVQSVAIRNTVEPKLKLQWDQQRILDQFELDMRSALKAQDNTKPTIQLPTGKNHLVEVFGLADYPDTSTPFSRRIPAKINYYIEDIPSETDAKRLVREVRYLTDKEKKTYKQVLTDQLTDANVEQFVNQKWVANKAKSRDNNKQIEIEAVRLVLVWKSQSEFPLTKTVVLNVQSDDKIE